MAVFGYSERGIICSIAYFLEANSQYTYDFINILGIQLDKDKKDDYTYTFLVEQSFSDFGDSDLIIIIEKETEKIIVFVECKIKTYQGTFQINSEFNKISKALNNSKKMKGISSNLFVQLYYKYLLIKTGGDSSKDTTANSIFNKHNNNPRILGSNKIVLNAFDKIKNANEYYYVAITPTAPNEMDNNEFRTKIKTLDLMPEANIFLCYWGNIEKYFDSISENNVKKAFEYNNGQIYQRQKCHI